MNEYKRLNRNLIAKGSIIDYYQDDMLVPNGNIAKWDHIEHKGAAAMVAVREDGKLVMVRQYRNSLERYTLEIPAGGLNKDEETGVAAARELTEETGYIAGNVEFMMSIRTTVAFCNEKIDIYLATGLTMGETNPDEDEYVEVECYTLDELLQMIRDGAIQDSKTVCAILYYAQMKK